MAIFDPKNLPVISKLTIGDKTYYLKDAEARELLAKLGTAAQKDVAAGVSADEQGLVTGAQVQAAIAGISGSMHFRGVVESFDDITDPAAGDVIIIGVKEYVYGGEPASWHELGDESIYALKTVTIGTQNLSANINLATLATDMGLGALSKKDSATGTVPGQTISGVKATGKVTGSIAVALNQTATAATLAKSAYTPAGEIAADVTATGKVSIAKDAENGVQISGSVSAPTVTVTPATDSIKKVTSVGTLPTKAADSFTANGDDEFTQGSQAAWSADVDEKSETLSFSFTANTLPTFKQGAKASYTEGAFDAGSLPTLAAEGTAVVTGITSATATAPVFTGDKFAATFTGDKNTVNAAFTGTEVQVVSGVTYDKATVNAADTKFTADAVELAVGDITVAAKDVTVQ
jgi:hypothetical protein|nr:MAG TPA: hypothetical protein [Bacteriophage sp.]